MDLIIVNPETVSSHSRTDVARVNMAKAGAFLFNKAAVILLSLTAGCKVELLQDKENPTDWYVRVNEPAALGFKLIDPNKKDGCLQFNSSAAYKMIAESVGGKGTMKFIIAGIGTEITVDGEKNIIHALLMPARA